MTSANGTPAGNSRRPSAAFPRGVRGALPSGENRMAGALRRGSIALALLLVAAPLATASARSSHRPAGRGETAEPRLPDAPQELIPPTMATAMPGSPRAACLAAARRAERVHGLPQGLLVAIALSESGLHAHALNIAGRSYFPGDLTTARRLVAQAPARHSIMAGCVQVNARVHARGADWPLDPVRATDWAGGMLRRWYTETGTWEEAIRRWHGGSHASSQRVVCRVRAKLEVTAPGSTLLRGRPCHEAETLQARRNGATLLEVAEMQDSAN